MLPVIPWVDQLLSLRRIAGISAFASYETRVADDEQAETQPAFDEIGHITHLRLVVAVMVPGIQLASRRIARRWPQGQ